MAEHGRTTHQYCRGCDMWRPKPFMTVIDRCGKKQRRCSRCAEDIMVDRELREELMVMDLFGGNDNHAA